MRGRGRGRLDLLQVLDVPTRILPRVVEPGTLVGYVGADAHPSLRGTRVVAPACHDTGSAVAAVRADGHRAFLSSGTWSLLGTELDAPVITPRARELNFTNEGGVCGTTRLLKNIAGLWLLQACRRNWAEQGHHFALRRAAVARRARSRPAFRSLFDPDHPTFLHPREHGGGDRRLLPGDGAARARRSAGIRARDSREPRVQVPASCSNRSRS